ncbi:TauD/TfdA family dioxygenase [Rhodobacteraceae bacterium]|nr:TauD/TfdA family dioxygenase [Paracoccaceae bacterium]|tara:strand:- start:4562 stop:5596 length:1035 start_codon:yes stop_codon:yes gene_type:complete
MKQIYDNRSWLGSDLQDRQDLWKTYLSLELIDDLEQAANNFLSLGIDVSEISPENFPLRIFNKHLSELSIKLLDGIGFEVITGLPVYRYSAEMIAIIFCGIGAYLGDARSQNSDGHLLGHVRDIGANPNDQNTRIYQTSQRQTFHTDSADVVGLLCVNEAKEGGDSLLVSAVTIFNQIVELRPDLVEYLFDPIATDRRGEVPTGELPFLTIPPLSLENNLLTVFYQRQYIDSAQRFSGVLKLSKKHIEALDLFDSLANNTSLHLSMRLRPGDMQFVYNHAFLHDRTGFVDWTDSSKKRHLLRLWLSMPNDRDLPECFKQRYGSIEVGNRGGIITQKTKLQVPFI